MITCFYYYLQEVNNKVGKTDIGFWETIVISDWLMQTMMDSVWSQVTH